MHAEQKKQLLATDEAEPVIELPVDVVSLAG